MQKSALEADFLGTFSGSVSLRILTLQVSGAFMLSYPGIKPELPGHLTLDYQENQPQLVGQQLKKKKSLNNQFTIVTKHLFLSFIYLFTLLEMFTLL